MKGVTESLFPFCLLTPDSCLLSPVSFTNNVFLIAGLRPQGTTAENVCFSSLSWCSVCSLRLSRTRWSIRHSPFDSLASIESLDSQPVRLFSLALNVPASAVFPLRPQLVAEIQPLSHLPFYPRKTRVEFVRQDA